MQGGGVLEARASGPSRGLWIMESALEPGRQIVRWHLYPDRAALDAGAVRAIARIAREAANRRGAFRIVLAGGSTPRSLYEQLRTLDTCWNTWHVYFGDERCLPDGHPDRNSTLASVALLDHVPVPGGQVHPIGCGQEPAVAAQSYATLLSGVDCFDLVLLGLGEDGHTASLFPGASWGTEPDAPAVIVVERAPKPPARRISLSAERLGRTRVLMVLVAGENKRAAVAAWRTGKVLPAGAICPAAGVDVLLDPLAWGAPRATPGYNL